MQLTVSQQGPIYSITDALQQAQPGDTIFLQDTHYDEFFTVTKNVTIRGNKDTVCTGGFKVERSAVVLFESLTFSNTPRLDCLGDTTLNRVHIVEPKDPIALFAGSSTLTLLNCRIITSSERDQGIQVKNGKARLESTLISGPFNVGCFINHSDAIVVATYFERNFKGLQFERESTGEVNECSFAHHSGTQCVVMSNSKVRIKNTRWQNGQLHALSVIEESDIKLLHCEFTEHKDYQIYVRESTASFESCHLEKAQSGILLEHNSKARLLYVTCQQHENLQVKSIGPNDLHIEGCVFNDTNGNSLNVKEKGKAIVERTLFITSRNEKYPQLYVEDSIVDLNECTFKRGASSAIYGEQNSLITLRNCEIINHQYIQIHVRSCKLHLFNCAFTQCSETAVFYERSSEGVIDGCHFGRSYSSQLAFNENASATVKNTSFTSAGTNALYISASMVRLEHIFIHEHMSKYPAIFIQQSTVDLSHVSATNVNSNSVDIRDDSKVIGSHISLLQSSGAQMIIDRSKAQLTHLQLADGKHYGLQLLHSDVSIAHSDIRHNERSGIHITEGETTLQHTYVSEHTHGVQQYKGSVHADGLQFVKNELQWQGDDAETFIKHSQFRTGGHGLQFTASNVHFQNCSLTEHDYTQLSLNRSSAVLTNTFVTAGFGDGLHAVHCPIVQLRNTVIQQHDGENIITEHTTITNI